MEICRTARTQHDMTGPRKREGDKKEGGGGLDFSQPAYAVNCIHGQHCERGGQFEVALNMILR